MTRRAGRPVTWTGRSHSRPMTPLPSSMKRCPWCETSVAQDDTDSHTDSHGRRWHGRCMAALNPPACPMCRGAFAEGEVIVEDTEGRRWHAGCAEPFVAHNAITLAAP